jgi:hypothetical protein
MMRYSLAFLALTALANATPVDLDNQLGVGSQKESDVSSDSEAFELRRRDLAGQGFNLAVHDVTAITAAAVDQGKFSPAF